MIRQGTTENISSVEQLLGDATERLSRNSAGRRAVVMHLSRLKPDNRGLHQLRIAANTFEALVKSFDGQIFVLSQGDIVFVCREEAVPAIDEAVNKLRYLFGDDPLVAQIEAEDAEGFSTWFTLGGDFAPFQAYVTAVRSE